MEEYRVGGKITLLDNTSYRIVDIIKENETEYLFCCTTKKPITPKVFEKKVENGKVFVRLEDDPEILIKISNKLSKDNNIKK